MANGSKARRRRRRRRWLPAVVLSLLGIAWVASLRYRVAVGGDPNGDVNLSIAHLDASPGDSRVHWHVDADWCFLTVQSSRGRVAVVHWRPNDARGPASPREWPGVGLYRSGYGDPSPGWFRRPIFGTATSVAISYWLLALPPAAWAVAQTFAALGRRRRTEPGRCASCGYDLRGSPERCPECGLAVGA